MIQRGFSNINKPLNHSNKTGKQLHNLDNTVNRNSGFTLIEMAITSAIVGILAAIAVPNYSDYIKRTKLVACFGDTRILNLEYTIGQTGNYSSTTALKDDLLTKFEYTKVSDGVYNCPSCDDDVYANVSLDADDKLETSCSLEADTTTTTSTDEETETETETETASTDEDAVEAVTESEVEDVVETVAESATKNTEAALVGFAAAYTAAIKAAAELAALTGTKAKYVSGTDLLTAYTSIYGAFEQVDASLIEKYGLGSVGTLYWKADTNYSLNTGTEFVMYAGTSATGNSSYSGYLASYKGVTYYSTTKLSITGLGGSTTVAANLLAAGWKVAE